MLVDYEDVKDDLDRMAKKMYKYEEELFNRNKELMVGDIQRYCLFPNNPKTMERMANGNYVLYYDAMKLLEQANLSRVVFKCDGIELSLGDSLVLPEPTDDDMFYSSNVGKKFKEGVCDKITLTAYQKDTLEVCFEAHAFKNNHPVTEVDFHINDGDGWSDNIWCEENAGYMFAMYLVKKGAKVLLKAENSTND